MKLVFLDNENMLLFLNQFYQKKLDFSSVDSLEEQLKDLLFYLKQIYHLKISGYYSIYVTKDENYGMILKIHREELDEFDYFHDEIEICLHINKEGSILYQVEDPTLLNQEFLSHTKLYYYENCFYFELQERLKEIEMGQFLEFTQPTFIEAKEITKYGKEIFLSHKNAW
ncbi:MAG: hypothetical protein KH135_01235 [Firmicutes bacterium]|nr:hypothetical protein [Bacillota bacterium]